MRRCQFCNKAITFKYLQWYNTTTDTDCPKSNVGHSPAPKEPRWPKAVALSLLAALVFAIAAPPRTTEAYHTSSWQCTKYEPTYRTHAPAGGWDVNRMSYYSYRESRCIPGIVNVRGGDTGLFQIHPINWRWLASKFKMTYSYSSMRAWLKNPTNNTRAAAALCTFARRAWGDCYRPWRT